MQAYPDEDMDSTVLLQNFCQAHQNNAVKKIPDNLSIAVNEYPLQFEQTNSKPDTNYPPEQAINMLKDGNKCSGQQDDEYAKLQKTLEALTKQLESLEATLHCKSQETRTKTKVSDTQTELRILLENHPIGPCYCCGQEGHLYCQCPLNYQPASKVDNHWPQL